MYSDPNANYVSPKHIQQRLAELNDPDYVCDLAKATAFFADLDEAKKRNFEMENADTHGMPSEILLRNAELPKTKHALNELETRLHELRGDNLTEHPCTTQSNPPINTSTISSNSPLPLSTCDIAHCFAGLRWTSEVAWKKPLGDKPKWLKACVVIPGSRGVSETRWNPLLIGAALVHGGYVKQNRVRAKFQTMPLLQPWLEAWKAYEVDNFETQ